LPLVRVVTGLALGLEGVPVPVFALAPLVRVATGLPAAGAPAVGVCAAAGVPALEVLLPAALPLVWVVTGAAVAPGALTVCAAPGAGVTDGWVAVRARLVEVRGAPAAIAVTPGVVGVVVTPVAPGRGGAVAAGVRERLGCVGFSCLTIHTVRRTTCVRTSTGGAGGAAFTAGRSAKVVNAPSATRVTAPAIVVAGVFRISLAPMNGGTHTVPGRW
jgi:hypothetical protein